MFSRSPGCCFKFSLVLRLYQRGFLASTTGHPEGVRKIPLKNKSSILSRLNCRLASFPTVKMASFNMCAEDVMDADAFTVFWPTLGYWARVFVRARVCSWRNAAQSNPEERGRGCSFISRAWGYGQRGAWIIAFFLVFCSLCLHRALCQM